MKLTREAEMLVLLSLPPFFWSSQIVIGRAIISEVPPFSLTLWSMVAATFTLLVIGGKGVVTSFRIVRKEWMMLVIAAFSGVTAFKSLYFLGVEHTTAVNASILGPTLPIIIAVFAWMILGERMTPFQILGLIITIAGVLLVSAQGNIQLLLMLQFNAGDILIIASFVAMAVYTTMLRKIPTSLTPLAFVTVIFFLATLMLIPFYLWELQGGSHEPVPWRHGLSILYIGVVVYLFGILSWNVAVSRLGAMLPGLCVFLIPVYGTVLSVVFLQEKVYWYHLAGMIMICSGLFLSVTCRSRNEVSPELEPGS